MVTLIPSNKTAQCVHAISPWEGQPQRVKLGQMDRGQRENKDTYRLQTGEGDKRTFQRADVRLVFIFTWDHGLSRGSRMALDSRTGLPFTGMHGPHIPDIPLGASVSERRA
ncbi:hypothetical protein WMY93_025486 [Mugilogobius chulae]|uniref:Uncharacterized protein n=1 Tax=Mugilogobius chulae TaxID=88201 RepID=A0AAW0NF32_9GOBI